jgi:hypothetical protein
MHTAPSVSLDNVETIASFAEHGMQATVTLLALCRLLGQLRPTEQRDGTETAVDLVNVCVGLEAPLRVVYDAFDNIQVLAETSADGDGSEALEEGELTDHQEPVSVL